jgi:hypothetical protein
MQSSKTRLSEIITCTVATVAIWLFSAEMAQAAMVASVESIVASMRDLPTVLSGAAYLYGAGTVLEGANRLKKYSEDPTKGGAWGSIARIGIGGSFAALPMLIGWINNSLSIGNGSLRFDRLQKITALIDPSLSC